MRAVPDTFDPHVVSLIDARLAQIEVDHGVRVLWAIESGSRAWGFASPDSDYDCRFLYVRPREAYLDLWPGRDVIETPLEGLLDVNGWDLAKAVRLAVAGNATVAEWLRSPWIYRGEQEFRDALLELVGDVADRARLRRHYLHVGRDQWSLAGDGDGVRLKKVFYAVRPALTLTWLDAHTGVPPMDVDSLLDQVELTQDVRAEIDELRALKAVTRELGTASVPPHLAAWVAEVLGAVEDEIDAAPSEVRTRANEGFLSLLGRWAPA
ncbi:MAG: DNA polymerase beta superfamily protein [Nocardioides sp.]|uniref:nucleotidyltransferase domain-containing protein n=1 Tax=Nocardioides sp. TaxID=35761 RepID=UPI003F0D12A9